MLRGLFFRLRPIVSSPSQWVVLGASMVRSIISLFLPKSDPDGWAGKALNLFRLALLGMLTVVIGNVALCEIERYRLLSSEGITVQASVVDKRIAPAEAADKEPSRTIAYEFKAENGETIRKERTLGVDFFNRLTVGGPIEVTYARSRPSTVHLGRFEGDLVSIGLTVLIFVLCAYGVMLALQGVLPRAWTSRADGLPSRWLFWIDRGLRIGLAVAAVVFANLLLNAQSSKDRLLNSADARTTDATVIEKWKNGEKRKSYWISYRFATEAGREIVAHNPIDSASYSNLAPGSTVAVTYAASNPATSNVGSYAPNPLVSYLLYAAMLAAFIFGAWQIYTVVRFERMLRKAREVMSFFDAMESIDRALSLAKGSPVAPTIGAGSVTAQRPLVASGPARGANGRPSVVERERGWFGRR